MFNPWQAWGDFKRIQDEFITYMGYVPLRKTHDEVWSPKLEPIFLDIGSKVDIFFKNMLDYDGLDQVSETDEKINEIRSKSKPNIKDYRDIFEPYYKLSEHEIEIRQDYHIYNKVRPFYEFANGRSPTWWEEYQDIKHNGKKEKVNLKNVVEALAGLFLLNIINIESRDYLVDNRVIVSYGSRIGKERLKGIILKRGNNLYSPMKIRAETPIFRIDFYKRTKSNEVFF